jgi:hypothetical protein
MIKIDLTSSTILLADLQAIWLLGLPLFEQERKIIKPSSTKD